LSSICSWGTSGKIFGFFGAIDRFLAAGSVDFGRYLLIEQFESVLKMPRTACFLGELCIRVF
jgi:hypothetical protein